MRELEQGFSTALGLVLFFSPLNLFSCPYPDYVEVPQETSTSPNPIRFLWI